jgi:hypothetical protein
MPCFETCGKHKVDPRHNKLKMLTGKKQISTHIHTHTKLSKHFQKEVLLLKRKNRNEEKNFSQFSQIVKMQCRIILKDTDSNVRL